MDSRPYTVHIYEDEASRISNWTLQYFDIETGGDIFGLWLNENEVVIQAVLGPGRNCRRTTTSFFQDEQYLSRVGGLLTNSQGLCNVGSWHSHHTMNLPDPSRGDKDTVWRHLPTPGRFVLLIATIEMKTGAPKVQMGFNLFESTNKGNKVIPMQLGVLQGQSPIRANKAVSSQMIEGAEVTAKVQSKKMTRPEPSVRSDFTRPEIDKKSKGKSNTEYDGSAAFFNRQKSDRQGHRKPLQQDTTCDGVRSYYTFPPGHSEVRPPKPRHHAKHERPAFTYSFYPLPDGREGVELKHHGHPLGSCEDCRNIIVRQRRDGKIKMYVEHRQGEPECCCCIL
ncbi:Hypothetical predicted protein [Paramuricea clavata]|uniref:Uncharacterized protein n=1 Tax=Paramuricea clavata TaxID=317549 RepID=A0A6S7J6P4_PARCT|nr:Hypothetical predicted protein [Paramuricea clavata]